MDRQKLGDTILDALKGYRLQSIQDEEGNGIDLIDVLSVGPTIAEGILERERLAEHIADALETFECFECGGKIVNDVCPHCESEKAELEERKRRNESCE